MIRVTPIESHPAPCLQKLGAELEEPLVPGDMATVTE